MYQQARTGQKAFDVCPLSLAPGFSRVSGERDCGNRFNGFCEGGETVETVLQFVRGATPG